MLTFGFPEYERKLASFSSFNILKAVDLDVPERSAIETTEGLHSPVLLFLNDTRACNNAL